MSEEIKKLYNEDDKIAYKNLLELETKASESDEINNNFDLILRELDDDVSTSVRQCLDKLNLILIYKPELSEKVEMKLEKLDLSKYKNSMKSLIKEI